MKKLLCLLAAFVLAGLAGPVSASDITDDELFGTVEESRYENAFIGISCDLEGWTYTSKGALKYNPGIMVMQAISPNEISNVNIQARDLRPYTEAPSSDRDLEAIYDMLPESLKSSYESRGFRNFQAEKSTIELSGKTISCLCMSFTAPYGDACQKEFMYLLNRYLVFVTVTGLSFDETDEILSHFSIHWAE